MSLFGVQAKKENDLRQRMVALGIREEDLVEKFVRGSGRGGQKINKTSSCVYLLHRPTGIEANVSASDHKPSTDFWRDVNFVKKLRHYKLARLRTGNRKSLAFGGKSAGVRAGRKRVCWRRSGCVPKEKRSAVRRRRKDNARKVTGPFAFCARLNDSCRGNRARHKNVNAIY